MTVLGSRVEALTKENKALKMALDKAHNEQVVVHKAKMEGAAVLETTRQELWVANAREEQLMSELANARGKLSSEQMDNEITASADRAVNDMSAQLIAAQAEAVKMLAANVEMQVQAEASKIQLESVSLEKADVERINHELQKRLDEVLTKLAASDKDREAEAAELLEKHQALEAETMQATQLVRRLSAAAPRRRSTVTQRPPELAALRTRSCTAAEAAAPDLSDFGVLLADTGRPKINLPVYGGKRGSFDIIQHREQHIRDVISADWKPGVSLEDHLPEDATVKSLLSMWEKDMQPLTRGT